MTTARSRNRLTAWLGIFAMWLIVIAPSVSRGLAARDADTPIAPICSVDRQSDADQHAPAVHFDACGYCDLLAHHVPAPASAIPQLQAVESYGVEQPSASLTFVSRDVRRAARPRDSPSSI
ncbi:DUF2946 domain-containing protein [Burkholderia vietnamiensis]|uniref:DUF2946 domain-containing protein n=1 Tax=Burkholderia vietnamiensis TaxID=60552 RepID=UPI0009BD1194|nr:DUF2946 domain-containing protein [Burkholderia vietnamiensis]MBR8192825.1 DUF2946 domain-containing protein [Burkholderia vietnamiensis]MBR8219523.1 DUF2946 domain-containing protein [Burkholderia vietnamiensis]